MTSLRKQTLRVLLCCALAPAVEGISLSAQQPDQSRLLTLGEAVAKALEYHPSIQAADAMVDAAQAGVGEAQAYWFPQLGLDASATRFQEPMIVSPIHEFTPEAIPPFDRTLYGGSATLGFLLFDGGARTARIRGARADARAAGAGQHETEMALIARVTVTYLQVLTAGGVLDAHDRRLEALEAEHERVARLLTEGAAARVSLMRIEAALASAEADHVRAAAALDVAQRSLARLIGTSADETRATRLVPISLREAPPGDDRDSLLAKAAGGSPELRRVRESLRAAEASRNAATGTWFPRLDLIGAVQGYGYPDGFTTEWRVGARLSYPIFTGGARSNSIARAGAAATAAREQVRLTEMTTQEDLDQALTMVQESEARVAATARAVEHQTEVARIEQLALAEGAGTQTDYLAAEADLFAIRSALIESRHTEIAARVALARVVGDLSLEWLANAVENDR
jgi:outer membrane protein TolC